MKNIQVHILFFLIILSGVSFSQTELEITSSAFSYLDENIQETLPMVSPDNTMSSSFIGNISISDEMGGAVPMDIIYLPAHNKFYVYGKRRLLVIDANSNTVVNSINISTNSQYHPVARNGENRSHHEIHFVLVNQNGTDYVYCVTESLEIIKINTQDDTWTKVAETPANMLADNFYSNTKIKYDQRTNKIYWMLAMDTNGSSVFIYDITESSLSLINRIDLEDPYIIKDIAINQEIDEFYISVDKQLRVYNAINMTYTILVEDSDGKGDLIYINEDGIHKLYCFSHDWGHDDDLIYQIDFNDNNSFSSFPSPLPNETACYFNPVTNEIYLGFSRFAADQHDIHILDPITNTVISSFNTNIYSPHFSNQPVSFERFNNKVLLCKNNEIVIINEQDYTFSLLETAQYNMYQKCATSTDHALVISPWSGNINVVDMNHTIEKKLEIGASLYFGCFNPDKSKAYFYHKEFQGKSKVYILNTISGNISSVEVGNNISDMFVYAPDENTNRVYVSFYDETHIVKAIDGETDLIVDSQYWIFLNEDYCGSMYLAPNNKLYCMVGLDNYGSHDASIEIRDASNGFAYLDSHYYPNLNGALDGEFCYNSNNNKVYATAHDLNGYPDFGILTEIDGETNVATDYTINNLPNHIVCSQVNNKVYIQHITSQQSITVFNPKTTNISYVNVGYEIWGIEYDPTRDLVFTLYNKSDTQGLGFIDDETFVPGIDLPNTTISIKFNPGNSDIYAYVPHNVFSSTTPEENEIWQCRLEDYIDVQNYDLLTQRIPLENWHTNKFNGFLFENDILFDENQSQIYVANGGQSNISVLSYEPLDYILLRSNFTWLSIPRHERPTVQELTPTNIVFAQENMSAPFTNLDLLYNFITEDDDAGHENIVEANYFNYNWNMSHPIMDNIHSTRGYIVKNVFPNQQRLLKLSGEQEDPGSTIDLYCKKQNWIGYFLEEEQDVFDALADIMPNIYHIQHQNYNCWRHNIYVNNECGQTTKSGMDITPGTWVCNGRPVIKYGEMIKVTPFGDYSNFQWNWSGNPPNSQGRPELEYYTYEEEADYETFVIVLDTTENNPTEIGAFVNDTCVGACSVTELDTVVVLSAYINQQPGDSVVFEKYYAGTKMGNVAVDDYFVKNNKKDHYEKRAVQTGEKQEAFIISFNKKTAAPSGLDNDIDFKVYPNPAHNILNYSFTLEEESFVKISIFDIKGKFIVELLNGTFNVGSTSSKINLNDFNGNKFKPGIYFVKARMGNSISTKKLVVY